MHQEILPLPDGAVPDHINDNKSGFKGVAWREDRQKWQGYITANRKRKHLGYFEAVEVAARAYDDAATLYHSEFARPNFPTGGAV